MKKNKIRKQNKATEVALAPVQSNIAPVRNPIAPFETMSADLDLRLIDPSPNNPRKEMVEEGLNDLAESIRKLGVQSQIMVRPMNGGRYEIVFGERRFRASLLAELTTIPAKIKAMSDQEAEICAIHENIQRENMTPFEEGRIFVKLNDERNMPVSEICATFAKSERFVRSRMTLTKLIPEMVTLLQSKEITLEIALILAKYDATIQKSTYDQHFKTGEYFSWRGISPKELEQRLFNAHLTKLSECHFDKTECNSCTQNTNNNVLFSDCGDCAACRNPKCMQQKNQDYLVARALELIAQDPYLHLIVPRSEVNKDVIGRIMKEGHEVGFVDVVWKLKSLDEPIAPDLSKIEDEDDRAIKQKNYEDTVEKYKAACAKYDLAVSKGKMKKLAIIRSRTIDILYEDVQETAKTKGGAEVHTAEESPAYELRKKDNRNHQICYEHITKELKKKIKECAGKKFPKNEITPREEVFLNYVMLHRISDDHKKMLGIKSTYGDDDERLKVAEKLSEKQKIMLIRMAIMYYCSDLNENNCNPESIDIKMMIEFADLHFPKQSREVQERNQQIYEKRHASLQVRIKALEDEKELLRLRELEKTVKIGDMVVDKETGEVLSDSSDVTPMLVASEETSESEPMAETSEEITPAVEQSETEEYPEVPGITIETETEWPDFSEEERLRPEEVDPSLIETDDEVKIPIQYQSLPMAVSIAA